MEKFHKLPPNILEHRHIEAYIRNTATYQLAQFSTRLPDCLEDTFVEILSTIKTFQLIDQFFKDPSNLEDIIVNKITTDGIYKFSKEVSNSFDYTSNPFYPEQFQIHHVDDREQIYSRYLDTLQKHASDDNSDRYRALIIALQKRLDKGSLRKKSTFLKQISDRDAKMREQRAAKIETIERMVNEDRRSELKSSFDKWSTIDDSHQKQLHRLLGSYSDFQSTLHQISELLNDHFHKDEVTIEPKVDRDQIETILRDAPLIIDQKEYWSADFLVNQYDYLMDRLALPELNSFINRVIDLVEEVIPSILNFTPGERPIEFPSTPLYFQDFSLNRWKQPDGFRISLRIFHTRSWDELTSQIGDEDISYPIPFSIARMEGSSTSRAWFETIRHRSILLDESSDPTVFMPEKHWKLVEKMFENDELEDYNFSEYLLYIMIETNAITYEYGQVDNETYMQQLPLFDDASCESYCTRAPPVYTNTLDHEFQSFTSTNSILGAQGFTKMLSYVFNHCMHVDGQSNEEVIDEIMSHLSQLYVVPVQSHDIYQYAVLSSSNYRKLEEYRNKQVGYDQLLTATKFFTPTNLTQQMEDFQQSIDSMTNQFSTLVKEVQYLNKTPGGRLTQILAFFQKYQSLTRMELIDHVIEAKQIQGDDRAHRTLYEHVREWITDDALDRLGEQGILEKTRDNPNSRGPPVYRYHYIGKTNLPE